MSSAQSLARDTSATDRKVSSRTKIKSNKHTIQSEEDIKADKHVIAKETAENQHTLILQAAADLSSSPAYIDA